ncbi:MAG: hypothetical protein JO148_13080 [Acidimicrobiia bacterium]|nr:hypothetical protein [Acidimicrobiia bacterium]
MSAPVALQELASRVEEFGPHAFLVTTSPDRRPHIVSVTVRFDGARFSLPVGKTSRANVAATEAVSLLWQSGGGPYSLIVDGAGTVDGDSATVSPTRAVLHRLADAPADLPSCIRIE